jgi:serine protease Do
VNLRSLVALCFVAVFGTDAHAQQATHTEFLEKFSDSLQALSRQVTPSVVQVLAVGLGRVEEEGSSLVRAQRGTGSGFVVDREGYILTNLHVVQGASRVEVLLRPTEQEMAETTSITAPAGRVVPARVVGSDAETDLALLKVDGVTLPALRLADSEKLRQGQLVIAAGSPLGLRDSITFGVISATARQLRPDSPMIYIQTDAPINPGNSGGPLVNSRGEVVGVNTLILSQSGGSEGIGFAVPSNIVKAIYQQIRNDGTVKRGQIGVVAQTITPQLAKALQLDRAQGVILSDVTPRGAAEAAGLEARDIVVAMNGKRIDNARQFRVNIYQQKIGSTVKLTLLRKGETVEKEVAVLERQPDPKHLDELIDTSGMPIRRLGIFAIPLEGPAYQMLEDPRRLKGAVVAGRIQGLVTTSGLEAGDIIYELNGETVANPSDLARIMRRINPGEPVALWVQRGPTMSFVTFEAE